MNYIDSSYIKRKIAVKPIYKTLQNLTLVVSALSGTSMAWQASAVSALKKASVRESDACQAGTPSPVAGHDAWNTW